MKYTVTNIIKNGGVDRIEFQKGKYILDVPKEADIKLEDKFNILVTENESSVPRKYTVQLFGYVIRNSRDSSLISAGGLLCQVPGLINMDQTIYIVVY